MTRALPNVLTITRVELLRFLRDRGNLFFVLILPLALIVFIGLQFGGAGGYEVGVVAPDDDPAAAELIDRLDASDSLTVVALADEEGLTSQVSRGVLSAGLVLPEDYAAALAAAEPIRIGYLGRPDPGSRSLRTVVEAAVADQSAASEAAHLATTAVGRPAAELIPVAEQVRADLPQVTVVTDTVGRDEVMAEFAALGQFDLGASGQLFLFVFLTSLAGSGALIRTRQYGVAARMLSTPTRLPVLLAGLAGGRFAIAAFQAVYIVAVTAVAFGVDWGDPLTTTLLILIYSILSAAAGMVLGSLFRNDSQATGAGIGIGLVFAALGGSMMALEFFPEGMRRVAMLTPHGWANTAMAEIVRRDGTITDVAIELGVLAAMAVGLLVLATWLLRRAITR